MKIAPSLFYFGGIKVAYDTCYIVESQLRFKTKIEPELVLAAASSSLGSVFHRNIGEVLQDL